MCQQTNTYIICLRLRGLFTGVKLLSISLLSLFQMQIYDHSLVFKLWWISDCSHNSWLLSSFPLSSSLSIELFGWLMCSCSDAVLLRTMNERKKQTIPPTKKNIWSPKNLKQNTKKTCHLCWKMVKWLNPTCYYLNLICAVSRGCIKCGL